MHTDQKFHILSTSSEQSLSIGKQLGQHVRPGQLIELIGDLGGGKTTLVKGIAAGLGITKTITSPTFSIQRSYELPSGGSLEHFDLYRLEGQDTVTQELEEYLADPRTIVVVEWTKPFVAALRPDRLIVELRWQAEDEREITITATGKTSQLLIEAMK